MNFFKNLNSVTGAVRTKLTVNRGSKYSNKGLYTATSFGSLELPETMKEALAKIANHSLAARTWSTYRTVENQLQRCQEETGTLMNFPLKDKEVIIFIHWLFESRKVSSSTVNSYLAGLRQLHLVNGVEIPLLRPPIVAQLLEGKKNVEIIIARQEKKQKRLPVTLNVMKLLKLEIKRMDGSQVDKALLWAVSTIAFNGCLRIHELLARKETEFDPEFTLLNRDILVKQITVSKTETTLLQIRLKSPKEDRIGKDKIIDVYQSNGIICPVKAYKRWDKLRADRHPGTPVFRMKDGRCLTGRKFNKYLKEFLGTHIDYRHGKITSHSFRAGMATLLGQIGFSDEDIMAIGRWSSDSFEKYLKLPRTKRAEIARKIGNHLV